VSDENLRRTRGGWAPGSPRHADGANRAYSALGGFVGPPDVVSSALHDRVLALDRDLDGCRYLVDSPKCRHALQARLRLIRDCACHSVTHLIRAHAPSVSSAAALLHDKLVRHAVFYGLAPPPDSPASAVRRAGHLLHLPCRFGGHGFTSAAVTAPAAFLASSLEAFSALRHLLPHFGATQILSDPRPTFVAMRAAHQGVLSALSVVSSGYDAIESSDPYTDAFGDEHRPFRPSGLPAFAPSPPEDEPDDDEPVLAAPPARKRPLPVVLPLPAYLDLAATRYMCAQRTFTAVLHHCGWLDLQLSGSARDAALLTSVSQRGAHDFHHASLSDPRARVPSPVYRLGLLYHLGLPIPGLASTDALGDRAVSTSQHSSRHSAVLAAWHHAAADAHSVAGVIREPADHSSYAPGKRPDLYVPDLNLALDVKTASLFTSKTSPALASHTALVATAEAFLLRAYGDPRSGGAGEYSPAVAKGTSVTLLISEVTGARHSHAERFLRACASAYTDRHPLADGSSFDPSFYARHSSFLSVASLRGLGGELLTAVLSAVPAASFRRRASSGHSSPACSGPHKRARLYC